MIREFREFIFEQMKLRWVKRHKGGSALPTRRSARLGHFRLFVLNSARLFSPPLGGDPEGAAPPPPPGEPPRAPARPPPETQTSRCSPDSRLSFTENGKGTRGRRKVQKPARTQSKEGSSHPLGGLKPPCHRVRKDTQTSRGEAKDVDQED